MIRRFWNTLEEAHLMAAYPDTPTHPVSEVLALTPEKPLFGHRSGKQSATHWIAFMKTPNALGNGRASIIGTSR